MPMTAIAYLGGVVSAKRGGGKAALPGGDPSKFVAGHNGSWVAFTEQLFSGQENLLEDELGFFPMALVGEHPAELVACDQGVRVTVAQGVSTPGEYRAVC